MKKSIILLAAVFVTLGNSLYAQEGKYQNGWFAGAGAGMNYGFDGQKSIDRDNSHNGAGFGTDIYFGNWFSDWGGFRVGFQGLSISDKYTDFGYKRYEYVHGDLLIRAHRSIVPYVHLGYAKIDNGAPGGGVGIAFPLYVSKRIAIVPDFKATTYSNRIYDIHRNGPAITLSATLGVSINLGRKSRTRPGTTVPPVVQPQIIRDTVIKTEIQVERDTVYVNNVIHDQLITTISADALFDTASDVLRPESKTELLEVVNWMNEHPGIGVKVEGHTDSVGGMQYNMDLSLRRAQSVKDYLVGCGIDPDLISTSGCGYTRPVADNSTPEGRQQNRRAEIRVR